MSKAFDKKVEALAALRSAPPDEAWAELRKAFKDRNNYVVAKAAGVAASMGLRDAAPDLAAVFPRFLGPDSAKTDPQCWAKTGIVKALRDLGHDDPSVFLQGIVHIQMEPVWGGQADSAGPLRSACAMSLAGCSLPRAEILRALVGLTGDALAPVRSDAFLAISQFPGTDTELILRTKALAGDNSPEVVGQCFTSLLGLAPKESLPFVSGFLARRGDLAMEAASALGSCPEPGAIELLEQHYASESDAELRRAILLSLAGSRLEQARDFLVAVVKNGRERDAVHARDALKSSRFREVLESIDS